MNTNFTTQGGAMNSSAPLTPASVTGPEREILISHAEQDLISMLEKYDGIEEFADILQSIRDYFQLRDAVIHSDSVSCYCLSCVANGPSNWPCCMSNPSILEP